MADSGCSAEVRADILEHLPQSGGFRFLDEIVELSDSHIIARYRFKGDEWFYPGHFPGNPITPGVILLEAMAQAGLVALGMHLLRLENNEEQFRTFFTECSVEFTGIVRPGDEVLIEGRKVYWRRRKLQSRVSMTLPGGACAAAGVIAGQGVMCQ